MQFQVLGKLRQLVILFLIASIAESSAQENRTVGLLTYDREESFEGYTLYSPHGNSSVYLISNCGELVNRWNSEYPPGAAVYLTEDGTLFRAGRLKNERMNAGGSGGIIERFSWDGELLWQYVFNDENNRQHHDFQVLPNGNVLLLAWEYRTEEEALAAGRKPGLINPEENSLWPEQIVEVKPTGLDGGEIVWRWRSWDHLIQDHDIGKPNYGVVSEHPGRIDINYAPTFSADWHHANAIDYNPVLDQIVISIHAFDEFWVIDHGITEEEAAGSKGDLLYRWGNPETYGQGSSADKKLFKQHNVHWIPKGLPDEGKLLIFNNGKGRPDAAYSSVVKLSPPLNSEGRYEYNGDSYLPQAFDWEYVAPTPTDFYSWFISGAQQLPNGNVLVNNGARGTFFELNPQKEIVWEYVNPISIRGVLEQGGSVIPDGQENPDNVVFRAERYSSDFEGFTGRDVQGQDPLELHPADPLEACRVVTGIEKITAEDISVHPNPAAKFVHVSSGQMNSELRIFDVQGHMQQHKFFDNTAVVNLEEMAPGLYLMKINGVGKRLIVNK